LKTIAEKDLFLNKEVREKSPRRKDLANSRRKNVLKLRKTV
jgi:hypothetical protein